MDIVWEFGKAEETNNWLKSILSLWYTKKLLEPFLDEQIDIFHQELRRKCGPQQCVKKCHFQNWKPRPNQIPPLDCAVCSCWIEEIRANHTSPRGRVYWKNSEPHLWSEDKWEVAKVFMPDGHKKHKSLGDFDIAAFLSLMTQCKHFKRFEIGGLCQEVSHVRNNIMHSPGYLLKKEDLHSYLHQIKAFGEALAKHEPQFKRLSEVMDEIPYLDVRVKIEAQQEIQTVVQEDIEHNRTWMELDEDERDPDNFFVSLFDLVVSLSANEEFQLAFLKRRDGVFEINLILAWKLFMRKDPDKFFMSLVDLVDSLEEDKEVQLPVPKLRGGNTQINFISAWKLFMRKDPDKRTLKKLRDLNEDEEFQLAILEHCDDCAQIIINSARQLYGHKAITSELEAVVVYVCSAFVFLYLMYCSKD